MNNDYLRINSQDDDQEIVLSECDVKKSDAKKKEEKPVTVANILFSGKKKKSGEFLIGSLPSFKGGFNVFLAMMLISCVLLFIAIITRQTILFILDSLLTALILPLSIVIVFSDLNGQKNVKTYEMITAFGVGVIAFLAADLVGTNIDSLFDGYKTVSNIINIVLTDLFLFLLCVVYLRITQKNDIFTEILLCVCVYCGYITFWSARGLIQNLFIPMGNEYFSAIPNVITKDKTFTSDFMSGIISKGFYQPLLMIGRAVITSGVASLMSLPFQIERERRRTYNLFILIEIVLHILASEFASTVDFFNVILSAIYIIVSYYCAIKILNYALSKYDLSE